MKLPVLVNDDSCSRRQELEEELHEWEMMRDELQRADTHDWEKEHGRSKSGELQWVLGCIKQVKEKLS
jgi:hypothetical protein